MIDDVAAAFREVVKNLPDAIAGALVDGKPMTDEHIFDTLDGERGFAIFVVPTGSLAKAILESIVAVHGEPVTSFHQEFPR